MDTTVHLQRQVKISETEDLTDVVLFPDAKTLVDAAGAMHVHNSAGTIMSFSPYLWAFSVRGVVRTANGRVTVTAS